MYCVRAIFNVINRSTKPKHVGPIGNILKNRLVFQTIRNFSTVEEESDKIIHEICKNDTDLEKKLRILMLEVEVMRQDGRCAPSSMNLNQWKHLISLSSKNQRNNYLLFLWKTEKSKENEKARKAARKKEFESSKPQEIKEYDDDLSYGLTNQSLFLRIRDASMNNFDNYRALQAIKYGKPLIIDCSYNDYMVYREALNAAKQMTFVFGTNRMHRDPFDIHMCNVDLQSEFTKQLERNIPSLYDPCLPLNIHSNSYLDVFPKDKLVYLTPHCREELTKYDHDSIYIIGCMVDKINNEPLSLAKAKKDGLKMAKLPLDRYLEWAPGSKKNLNINHMVDILLDLKLTGDWEFALRHIPRRKLMETKILAMQKKIKNNNLQDQVMRNMRKNPRFSNLFPAKSHRNKSRKSLFDDDSI